MAKSVKVLIKVSFGELRKYSSRFLQAQNVEIFLSRGYQTSTMKSNTLYYLVSWHLLGTSCWPGPAHSSLSELHEP